MQQLPLSEDLFHGNISLEKTEEFAKPWRLPFKQKDLFPPNAINGQAEMPAGVRVSLISNTKTISIEIYTAPEAMQMDCMVDGNLVKTANVLRGERIVSFTLSSCRSKLIEIYLSQKVPVSISNIWIDEEASWEIVDDFRVRWITYGSSITHCYYSDSPSQTWPALVANELNYNLTCLGYSGNCHLEPMIARMIRDRSSDLISLGVGINIVGRGSLSDRTFAAALIGFIQIIREKQKDVPIVVISPIFHREKEIAENEVGLSLVKVREEIHQVVDMLKQHGDQNIYYIDGLNLFGEEYENYMPDGLHPNGEGDKILAVQFQKMLRDTLSI